MVEFQAGHRERNLGNVHRQSRTLATAQRRLSSTGSQALHTPHRFSELNLYPSKWTGKESTTLRGRAPLAPSPLLSNRRRAWGEPYTFENTLEGIKEKTAAGLLQEPGLGSSTHTPRPPSPARPPQPGLQPPLPPSSHVPHNYDLSFNFYQTPWKPCPG